MDRPLVSALVSTWRAERFMRGLLEDLEAQSIADKIEIIVVDSASPEREGEIVREFQQRYANIRYYRTACRENSHVTLNRAIALSRGRYLTVANTDDRHRRDCFELLARALEENSDVGIVYPDTLIGTEPNEPFEQSTASCRHDWPDYNHGTVLSCCLFGALSMWRREVHASVGRFDPELEIAGDQDLYARIALQFGGLHVRETLGAFLQRSDSNSGADRREEVIAEVVQVMRELRSNTPLDQLFIGLRSDTSADARAAALVEMGNLCALGPYNDPAMALDFYRLAGELGQESCSSELHEAFANNVGCVLVSVGMASEGLSMLQAARSAGARRNHSAAASALERGRVPALRELELTELLHPVVRDSRRAHGLQLREDGAWWRVDGERVPWDVFDGPNGVEIGKGELLRAQSGLPRSVPAEASQVLC